MTELKRLNKYISDTGFCSRRVADKLIESGQVTVNGKKVEKGVKVGDNDEVLVNKKPLKSRPKKIYMAFHKPVGITCTTDLKDPDNIIDYINYKERIFPIGRLDKMSEGLIFLTNDGDIVNKILRAGNNHEKEYIVTVNKAINDDFVKKMGNGVRILDTITQKCKVEKLNKNTFRITLTQGLNRQIRRMAEVFGYTVTKLARIRIMNVDLKGIESGTWRYLSEREINIIESMVANSSKTQDAPVKANRTISKTKSKTKNNKSKYRQKK